MALALTGARVWDGLADHPSDAPRTVRIEGDRIAAVGSGPELESGARGIHLGGATIIPGLIDAHVHLTLDPTLQAPRDQLRLSEAALRAAMQDRARRMLAAGITTARDLGGGRWLEIELREQIRRGEVDGPRLLCAGQPITSPGGHCHFWGGEARGRAGVAAVVRRQLAHDVDWIKAMVTGGVLTRRTRTDSVQLREDELRCAVELARAHGLGVAAHCHGTRGIALAAVAGVRTVEHCSFAGGSGFGSDLDAAVVETLAARRAEDPVWVSPTVNRGWARHLGAAAGGEPSPFGKRMSRVYLALREAGVSLVASTDAGIPGVEHHGLAEALPVFATLAGLSRVEVLRSATSESARALGLEHETGAVVAGRSADLLVLDGNPLDDLAALRKPRLVVARGRVLSERLPEAPPVSGSRRIGSLRA